MFCSLDVLGLTGKTNCKAACKMCFRKENSCEGQVSKECKCKTKIQDHNFKRLPSVTGNREVPSNCVFFLKYIMHL